MCHTEYYFTTATSLDGFASEGLFATLVLILSHLQLFLADKITKNKVVIG